MTERLAETGDVIRLSIPMGEEVGFRAGDRAVVTKIEGFYVFCNPLDLPEPDSTIELEILHGEYHIVPLDEIREEKIKKLLDGQGYS